MHAKIVAEKRKAKKKVRAEKTSRGLRGVEKREPLRLPKKSKKPQLVVTKQKESPSNIRKRLGISVLDPGEDPVPKCPHGMFQFDKIGVFFTPLIIELVFVQYLSKISVFKEGDF